MSSYPFFIPEFVLCANSSLFSFKIANEPSEFRNYLLYDFILQNKLFSVQIPVFSWCHFVAFPENPVKSPLTFKSCIHGNVRNAFVSTL